MCKVSKKKISQLIKELNQLSKENKTLKDHPKGSRYFYQYKYMILHDEEIDIADRDAFIDAYESVVKTTSKEEIDNDERAVTEVVRDEEGKITNYKFTIYRKYKEPIIGSFTRNEMAQIYRLYSSYGSALTQKQVSRQFPEYSLSEFKAILRAWQITKSGSAPFPLHYFEEYTEEELLNIQAREKENDFLRKVEKNEIEDLRKLNIKLAQKVKELEEGINKFNNIKSYVPETSPLTDIESNNGEKDLIIWLSDLHIGAYNEKYSPFELAVYNKEEIINRLNTVVKHFAGKKFDTIHVINLGDNIDSFKKETTRGGHPLPSVENDKDISKMFMECMYNFFHNIRNCIDYNSLTYRCIGESNHGGDWEWINQIALCHLIKDFVSCSVSDYSIDHFKIGDSSFVYTHGKNNYTQFKQFPLTLNDKTELYFSNYMREHNISSKYNYVVKGDLHRFAYTTGNSFDYISVGSMYGSSDYIASNFGHTKWSINYMTLDKNSKLEIGTIKGNE